MEQGRVGAPRAVTSAHLTAVAVDDPDAVVPVELDHTRAARADRVALDRAVDDQQARGGEGGGHVGAPYAGAEAFSTCASSSSASARLLSASSFLISFLTARRL